MMPLNSLRRILAAGALWLIAIPAGAAGFAGARTPVWQSHELGNAAKVAPVGGRLRLENVQLAETGEARAFLLERFAVFAPGAEIILHGEGEETVLPAPANAYFRGEVDGVPGSSVFLAVHEDGTAQGVVHEAEETYLIGGDDEIPVKALGAPLELRRVDPVMLKSSRGAGFACANDRLPQASRSLEDLLGSGTAAAAPSLEKAGTVSHTARVAVETDFEYLQRFSGNTTTATNFVGNLIGYASSLYVNEISTSLLVQSVSLWTTSSDPWNQTSTICGLMEFGRYWNKNKTGVTRTIAHFLSGKSLGGGIAWLGVLCSTPFNFSTSCPGLATDAPWGGAYGFTANISGAFNINNPTVVWDILAVSHEIGHNFNSPHTHCYNGIGGSSSPVDQCYNGEAGNGCYGGTQSLPGPAGSGSGTIMSYCHLLSPGMSNISLTFGTNHPYGVQPGRVPSRMSTHVSNVAASNAACLAPVAASNAIFMNGFESGTLPGGWNSVVP